MNKARLVVIVGAFCVAVIAGVMIPIATANSCGMNHGQKSKHETTHETQNVKEAHSTHQPEAGVVSLSDETKNVKESHSAHLSMISKSIDNAVESIKAGNNETALAELNKAQQMLAVIKESLSGHVESGVVNTKCPIMGSPINPEKTSDELVREFKGQKVAFCCGGCPGAWDKLSDAEKEAKLAKIKPEVPSHNHSN